MRPATRSTCGTLRTRPIGASVRRDAASGASALALKSQSCADAAASGADRPSSRIRPPRGLGAPATVQSAPGRPRGATKGGGAPARRRFFFSFRGRGGASARAVAPAAGELGAAELRNALASRGLDVPPDLDAVVDACDVAHSGSLNLVEFAAATMDPAVFVSDALCDARTSLR